VYLEESPFLAGDPEFVQLAAAWEELADVDHRDLIMMVGDFGADGAIVPVPDVPLGHGGQTRPVQLLDVVNLAYLDLSRSHSTSGTRSSSYGYGCLGVGMYRGHHDSP
jgi:hypothetical protein